MANVAGLDAFEKNQEVQVIDTSKKVRIAIIGTGWIAESHISALKKMEDAGLLTRKRSEEDERVVNVKITDKGMKLRDKCLDIPAKVGGCVCLKESDIEPLFRALHAILNEK